MKNKFISLLVVVVMLCSFMMPVCAVETLAGRRMKSIKSHVSNMLLYAGDTENSAYPNLFANGLNADTKEPVGWKMGGRDYIPANFLGQQDFLRTLVGLTELTGDSEYKKVADEQITYWLNNLTDANGLIYTGPHAFVDIKSGQKVLDTHENKNSMPYIEYMYKVAPEQTQRYIEAQWNAHILNWSNLAMDRHGRYNTPMGSLWDNTYTDTSVDFENENENVKNALAFLCTGNELINQALFLGTKTGDNRPVIWAKRMIQKYMDLRHPTTGLSGAQYGEYNSAYGGDRAQAQMGEDFGEIAYERNIINGDALKTLLGNFSRVLLKYIEANPSDPDCEKYLNYVVGNFKAFKNYAYDMETHSLKTPMFSDGTSLRGYTLKKSGYFGNAGTTFTGSGEYIEPMILRSAVYAYKLSHDAEIWEIARNLGFALGLGDLGTAPGEGINLNDRIIGTEYIFTLLDLYSMTNCDEYLAKAEVWGDMLVGNRYSRGMFVSSDCANASIDSDFMIALLNIEAAVQGKYNTGAISNEVGNAPIEMSYDGLGRVQDSKAIYNQRYKAATSVKSSDSNIVLPSLYSVIPSDGTELTDRLRMVQSLGHFTDKNAADEVTKTDFLSCFADLCAMELTEFKAALSDKVGDSNFSKVLNSTTNERLNLMNAATFAAGILMLKGNKAIQPPSENILDKYSDSSDIPSQLYGYVNTAASFYIVGKRGATSITPLKHLTASEASDIIMKTMNFCDNEFRNAEVIIEPEGVTADKVTYESSNENVFITDENGNLFPMGVGTAALTMTCGNIKSACLVRVRNTGDDAIRDIWVNGKRLDGFSTYKYNYSVLLGKDIIGADVTVRTFAGNKRTYNPRNIPGVLEIPAADGTNTYTVTINTEKKNVYMNEGFETLSIDNALRYGMVLNGVRWDTTDTNTPKIVADPKDPENQVLQITYKNSIMEAYATFDPIPVGAYAENNKKIVLEYRLMTTDTPPLNKQFTVALGAAHISKWGPRIIYKNEGNVFKMIAYNGGRDQKVANLSNGAWNTVKVVMDKQTLNHDVYFNGVLIKQAMATWFPVDTMPDIRSFSLTQMTGQGYETVMYLDDVKVYELPEEFQSSEGNICFKDTFGLDTEILEKDGRVTAEIMLPSSVSENDVTVFVGIHGADNQFKKVAQMFKSPVKDADGIIRIMLCENGFDEPLEYGDYVCVYIWNRNSMPVIGTKCICRK